MKIKYIPPHLKNKNKSKVYDGAGYFPNLKSAINYQNKVKTHVYHKDKVNCINFLVNKIKGKNKLDILDFGCGDGLLFKKLNLLPKKYIGIDVSLHMIELSKKNLTNIKNKSLIVGGVDKLKKIKSNSIDLFLAFNVIGYLTDKEEKIFFKEVRRILKKNKFFISTNGNELFDLFALNYHTKVFFKKYFNQKENHINLLLKKNKTDKYVIAKRYNPLALEEKLKKIFGLTMLDISFASLHKYSPEIGKILHKGKKSKNEYYTDFRYQQLLSRDYSQNPNKLPDLEKWKCLFLCSIFGMLVKK